MRDASKRLTQYARDGVTDTAELLDMAVDALVLVTGSILNPASQRTNDAMRDESENTG